VLILPLTRAMNRVPSVCEAMQATNGVRSNGLGYVRLGVHMDENFFSREISADIECHFAVEELYCLLQSYLSSSLPKSIP